MWERSRVVASESPEEEELLLVLSDEFGEGPESTDLLFSLIFLMSGRDASGEVVLVAGEGGLGRVGDWDMIGEGFGRVDVMLPLGLEAWGGGEEATPLGERGGFGVGRVTPSGVGVVSSGCDWAFSAVWGLK